MNLKVLKRWKQFKRALNSQDNKKVKSNKKK
jgi:hypothetical protein